MKNALVFVGNSCSDVLLPCNDIFLKNYGLSKSHLSNIKNHQQLKDIKSEFSNYKILPGGASANTAATLSHLGIKNIHFISNLSNDREGKNFARSMESSGIICHFDTFGEEVDSSTQVLCLTTPDGDRSFATYNGISSIFGEHEPPHDILKDACLLYLEGYALCSPYAHKYYVSAAETVRAAGGDVCFNMGDRAIMEKYPHEVSDILSFSTGFICNNHEAEIVYGSSIQENDLRAIFMRDFKFGAITYGKQGAWGFIENEQSYVEAFDVPNENIIDSVGAGDHFAAGFLYGYLSGWPLAKTCKFANFCGAQSLMIMGARYECGPSDISHLTNFV